MTTATKINLLHSVENQRILRRLVEREVSHCVSMMVSHFIQNVEALKGSNHSWEDDVLPLCECDDWETPVKEHEGFVRVDGDEIYIKYDGSEPTSFDDWAMAADALGIDEPHLHEALEHWIVSDWIADKLKEHGEIVGELFGLTIWGRCCSGQAILLDSVWCEIAEEMEILVGQKNEWK